MESRCRARHTAAKWRDDMPEVLCVMSARICSKSRALPNMLPLSGFPLLTHTVVAARVTPSRLPVGADTAVMAARSVDANLVDAKCEMTQ